MNAIIPYTANYRADLLRLLLELQVDYFHTVASAQLLEVDKETDTPRAYSKYIDQIESGEGGPWQVYLALVDEKVVGFIIGRVEEDPDLVLSKIGVVEDWYLQPECRSTGMGKDLYNKLEDWFREQGCQQLQSETWSDNQLSIDTHKKAGFFVWAVRFKKKL